MKMRHDSLTSSINIIHASLSRRGLKLEPEEKTLLVSTPVNQCSTSCCTSYETGEERGGCFGCQLKGQTPAEKQVCTLKVRKKGKGTVDSGQAETSCHAPAALPSEKLESPAADEGF